MSERRFASKIVAAGKARWHVPVPFDPADAWGERDRYLVCGTIAGRRFRGALEERSGGHVFPLAAHWSRDPGVNAGENVDVVMDVEGPQRDALAPDIAAALAASPEAARFFDALAQFYRKAYLRWIDATRRSPEERVRRIAEMVRLCQAGRKQKEPPGSQQQSSRAR